MYFNLGLNCPFKAPYRLLFTVIAPSHKHWNCNICRVRIVCFYVMNIVQYDSFCLFFLFVCFTIHCMSEYVMTWYERWLKIKLFLEFIVFFINVYLITVKLHRFYLQCFHPNFFPTNTHGVMSVAQGQFRFKWIN